MRVITPPRTRNIAHVETQDLTWLGISRRRVGIVVMVGGKKHAARPDRLLALANQAAILYDRRHLHESSNAQCSGSV